MRSSEEAGCCGASPKSRLLLVTGCCRRGNTSKAAVPKTCPVSLVLLHIQTPFCCIIIYAKTRVSAPILGYLLHLHTMHTFSLLMRELRSPEPLAQIPFLL